MLERYDRNGGPIHQEGCGVPQNGTPRDTVHFHRRPPPASTGSCSSTVDLLQPPSATIHPRAPVHPASTARSSTGYCSTNPLHGVLFNHPSMGYCSSSPPPATVQPALHRLLFNLPSMGSCSSSPPRGHVHSRPTSSIDHSGSVTRSLQCNRSGSVRAQRLTRVQLEPNASHPTRVRVGEKHALLGPDHPP